METQAQDIAKLNDMEEPNFKQFVKEIDEMCFENSDKHFTMFRYRVALTTTPLVYIACRKN